MTIGDRMIEGLCKQTAYAHPVQSVVVIETHISWVLLTGRFAYKIKKPVNFGFLDFSTLAKRRFYCEEELRLNRRFAETLYLDVVPVTGTPDYPIMGGEGEAMEYAVKMKQFPSRLTLAQLAEKKELNPGEIDQLANLVADFHQRIAAAEMQSPYGECLDIKKWFDENFDHIKPRIHGMAALSRIRHIEDWGNQAWLELSDFMHRRKQLGFVRECHGDLHLGNMTLIDDRVVLFDCIEFNPMLRWIDVISEVAFLLIDLWHAEYQELAFRFLNRYLSKTGDYSGLRLLRYYLVYRALVRAKVTLLRQEQQNRHTAAERTPPQYQAYVELAEGFTNARFCLLILMHGYSGSGKSWLAGQLAERIGAIHLRSDVERKRLQGLSPLDRAEAGIGEGLYSRSAGRQTYQRLAEGAADVLASGFSVIVDAAFLTCELRRMFTDLTADNEANLVFLDCRASIDTMRNRIERRRKNNNDPSDACIDVLMHQLQTAEDFSPAELEHVVGINTENADVVATVMSLLAVRYRIDSF